MLEKFKFKVSEIIKFKKFMHGNQSACFQVYSKNEELKNKAVHLNGKVTKPVLTKLASYNDGGMEIAMVINQTNGKGRASSDITKINAIFADFDSGDSTANELMGLSIQPHLLVETSPGKFHAYWLIKDCEPDQFSPVMKALAKKLGSDSSVCDSSRAMRMPGTMNWKYKMPFLAQAVHIQENPEPIFLQVFMTKMGLTLEKARLPEKSTFSGNSCKKLTKDLTRKIKDALKYLSADVRDIWQKVGMAIYSVDQGESGFKIWTNWSKTSDKYNADDQKRRWDEFVVGKGINLETLFWLANQSRYGKESALDEMSLASHFAETYKNELRYCRDDKTWYHYSGVVWKVDSQAPMRLAHKMIEAISIGDIDAPADKAVKRFRSSGALRGIVNHAELLEGFHITSQEFDRDKNLLALKNGVVDLTTKMFREAAAADYLRRHFDVEYIPDASCPEWIKFMKAITCEDRSLYEFIRRALGYTLFGNADQQIFFLAVGSGSNGKGVLMRTIQKVLGRYAVSVAPNLLTTAYGNNANSPSPALAGLCGARMVVCTELPSGRKFDEAFVKQYAGGDEITARHGYGATFSFKPEGKLWLSTNEVPEISAHDEAMWRRLKPIPFQATFTGKRIDHKLEDKLANEYSGILNWLLKGAKEFHEVGLGSCAEVDKMQAQLRQQADSLLAWMSECCVKSPGAQSQSSIAYSNYVTFMRNSGRKALSTPAFRSELAKKGIIHKKRSSSNFYEGFRIKMRE